MKMTIYCGKEKPLTAIGKNQCDMLDFAYTYPTWHYHSENSADIKAVVGLVKRGSIVLNEYDQFKINL
jgi:hypothetical protein